MKIVKPEIINDSVLTSSSIVEPDVSRGEVEWSANNPSYFSTNDEVYSVCGGGYRQLFAIDTTQQNVYSIIINQDGTTTITTLFTLNAATASPRNIELIDDTFLIVDSSGILSFYSYSGAYIGQVADPAITVSTAITQVEDGYIAAVDGGSTTKPKYYWCTGLTPASFTVGDSFSFGVINSSVADVAYNDGLVYAVIDGADVMGYSVFADEDDGTLFYTGTSLDSIAFNDKDNKFYVFQDDDSEGGAIGITKLNTSLELVRSWSAGDIAALLSTHSIYQSLAGSNTDRPDIGAAKDSPTWLKLRPTNKYAMFDGSSENLEGIYSGIINSQTESDSVITVELQYPVDVTSVCGFNIENCASIRVIAPNGTAPIDTTLSMAGKSSFSIFGTSGDVIELTITPESGKTVKVGEICAGTEQDIGESNFGGSLGLLDFSRVDTDTFGNVTVTPRRKVKIIDYDVTIDTENTQATFDAIADITSTPAVYAAESEFTGEALITFGIYQDFRLNVESPEVSSYTLSVQGLT